MKKKYILILYCFLTVVCYSQTKSGIAYYAKKTVTLDESKKTELNLETKKLLKKMQESLLKLVFTLKFKNDSAIFEEERQMSISNDLNIKLARVLSGVNGVIFYNDGIVIKEFEFAGQQFLIKNETDKKKWKLTNEKMSIEGYTCYKAIKKEKIEGNWGSKEIDIIAWYTPEIPINFGPDGYAGLPGLIVQIEKGKIITYLKKIEFTDKEIEIKEPTKGKKVTQEEFDAFVKQMSLRRSEIERH